MDRLKPVLLNLFKKEVTKKALAKILGSATAGGIYGWIIAFLVEQGIDKIIEPALELLIREGRFIVEVQTGKIQIKRLAKAKDENDESTYTDIIIDV